MSRARILAGLAALLFTAAACNAVLGIGGAVVDPSLEDGGSNSACGKYCTSVMQSCTGMNQEYIDQGTCEAMCQNFEPGTVGDTTQDSLTCRTHYATLAAADPGTNCRSAGPLGGSCGNAPCTAFCELDIDFCGSSSPPPYPGATGATDCVTDCQSDYPYLLDAGDISLSAGNTLNCRIYHLESAFEPSNPSAKSYHCPHTALASATCFSVAADAGTD